MNKKKARRALKQALMNLYHLTVGTETFNSRRQSTSEFKTLWARARAATRESYRGSDGRYATAQ